MEESFIDNLFKILKSAVKKSLQTSDADLQQSTLQTLESATVLIQREAVLHVVLILLFFIMVPTSKFQLDAIHVFIEIAKKENISTNALYSCYKREICEKIVQISAINYELIGWQFSTSLEKLSLTLGFFGSNDFLIQECRYLVPYIVPLLVKMPNVKVLLNEIATANNVGVPDLLASKYGNIFLNIFLNEPRDICKQCLNLIEKLTGTSGSLLRKRNFQVILNELLLHFNAKKDSVLTVLKLLAEEESSSQKIDIKTLPDYLQPRLLGVLAYFDIKLISKNSSKDKVLLSLATLLKFMGPKHVTPVRFKIIAMLRTALNLNHGKFPEINCKIWEVFVKSCEIDALGPQIALVFISLLPLHTHFPKKTEEIFKYLIIENENVVKDFIPDLFFVLENNVSDEICFVIRKHLQQLENDSFKEHLKWFLKYLNHESTDIKVHALKYLKRLLEKNREELDRMILGYNGIDAVIVEFLDILVIGCKDTDEDLKMGCGLCIGELGAIEPSHLPRICAQKSQTFTFSITEDSFIVDALNELIRALQAEKNTQNMDRFALAVQEILKMFGISPEPNSTRHRLWNQFPESQRELMLPLLSSRYTMAQTFQVPEISPIFGSSLVTSFQSWIHNWTCVLISAVKPDKRSLLEVCLPSLKQDNRTLMLFLPYILLHALLEGDKRFHQKVYEELMVLLNSYNNKRTLDVEVLDVRPLRNAYSMPKPQSVTSEEETQHQCVKVVFVLFDFLDRWLREWEWSKGLAGREHENYRCLMTFVSRFCKLQISRCNYECREYARALLYIEEYIVDDPDRLAGELGFLAELYAKLDEPDGVAGVMALQTSEPSIEQRILALEVSGKLADAAACYEKIRPPLKPQHLRGLVQCYLDLDNVNTALNFVEGALISQPECSNVLMEMQAEPLWRLGHFDRLDDLLQKPQIKKNNNCWGIRIGDALFNLRSGNAVKFRKVIDDLRMTQIENLGAASLEEGAYSHGYNYIAHLHVLNELEQLERLIKDLLLRHNDTNALKNIIERISVEWKLRMKIVQESLRIREPILCIRRVALEQVKHIVAKKAPTACQFLDSLLGELWLFSAKAARASGAHQQAYTYTLKAEDYDPPKLFIEKAKLHWLREEHELALTTLRRGVEEIGQKGCFREMENSGGSGHLTLEQKKLCAKAKLLIATYNDLLSNVDQEVNKQHYKEAIDVYLEWEKSLVHLAQYYDKIYQSMKESDLNTNGGDIQILMINYFGKSLQYGNEYVYQSMPRLLSIWFDYGSKTFNTQDNFRDKRKENLLKMTKLIDTYLERLPAYIFLTAFSQIVSRICHPQREVYFEVKEIILKLLLHYPQQCLWMIISVIKSSYSMRSKRCNEILNDSRLRTPSLSRLINDFTKLAEKLIDLCNKEIPEDVNTTTVSQLVRALPRLIVREDFSEIMIPTQKHRKLILPNPDFKCSTQHNPFPNYYVHITGIEDEVTVLGSLQRPRKITFKGSDGKRYVQMLKPKDDLRKDFRLMEFNDIVNQLLSRDADSRQRRLNIRLYSVAPLNEECGLIEWIPDLVGLRPVLMKIYKQKGTAMKARELKQVYCHQRDPLVKKKEVFLKVLLPNHPPVLGEWFRKTFPDAQSWLTARTAYIRTTAVMSMVGYIVGLGDRHGENILLDSTCGDAVHVDFNCLFNKGESLEWPERVPFRLTHNMISAMGPLGVEGMFRRSCACTLRVLRSNINTLMSIVTPFVYDPLVSWPKTITANAVTHNSERTNEQARDHIKNMELRLQGAVKTKSRSTSMLFSVEGQTNILISEAMNVDNLCQMFIGWGAYL
ncbi:serine/threonine-protein kinase ATR [Agrilus planipennis]|uniref:Serine/threonine-protein kinase ATR n=1 Tax=Agrilus planipennis TaxID=224129 RepID=A0A1W4WXP6_AGRPL|nr:serine/threonine-protein kinase ATR [Agrilus planipennis]